MENVKCLQHLSLPNNNLEEIDADLLVRFPEISYLDLSDNYIEQIHEQTFQLNSNLVIIILGHNRIKELHPNQFHGLVELQRLDLSNNQIEEIHPDQFQDLKSLNYINLGHNRIKELHPNQFHGLVQLNALLLSNNLIYPSLRNVLKNHTLTKLEINNNKIGIIQPGDVSKFNFTKLDFSRNLISRIEENSFIFLSTYKIIDFSRNRLSSLPNFLFVYQNKIICLDLSHNDFYVVRARWFAGLTYLTELIIHNNFIAEVDGLIFSTLNALSTLDISSNRIKIANFKSSSLRSLIISNNTLETVDTRNLLGLEKLVILGNIAQNNKTITMFQLPLSIKYMCFRDLLFDPRSANEIDLPILLHTREILYSNVNTLVFRSQANLHQNTRRSVDVKLSLLDISRSSFSIEIGLNMINGTLNASGCGWETLKFKKLQLVSDIAIMDLSNNPLGVFKLEYSLPHLRILNLANCKLHWIETQLYMNSLNLILDNNLINVSILKAMDSDEEPRIHVSAKNVFRTLDQIGVLLDSTTSLTVTNLSYKNLNASILSNGFLNINKLPNFDAPESKLMLLDLSYCQFETIDEGAFSGQHLINLYLHHNRLHYIHDKAFAYNLTFDTIDFSNNDLTDQALEALRNLEIRQHLDLSFNKLTTFTNFTLIAHLKSLILSNNELTQFSLPKDNNLEVLDVSVNMISNVDVAGCSRLKYINLLSTFIVTVNLPHFRLDDG
ncbi:hypothetical protein GJ496_000427 [Pomphorhynchus laevis]|nr:hypothetical protein GJ496_000427 [Pomphorhynchus laevis]